ncbi:MAG: EamA family transporter [Phycisphaeraceae bacterium]|nr:EamA family transporter [Phycisphaeraceae bacterium]
MGTSRNIASSHRTPSLWMVATAYLSLYFFWGSTYLGIKWAVLGGVPGEPNVGIPAFFLAGVRSVIAGVLMYVFLRWRGEARPTPRQWRSMAVVGTLLLLGGNGLVTFAVQYIPSGVAAVLIALLPIWMLVLEGFWGGAPLRERVSPALIAGIVIGLAGVGLLLWPKIQPLLGAGDGRSHVLEAVGAGAVLLSSFCWANGSLYSRRLAGRGGLPSSPFIGTAMQLICGGAALLVVSALLREWRLMTFEGIFGSPRPIASLAYLIFAGSLIGYTAYIWLLGVSTPGKIATYAYVNPIVALVIGSVVGKEELTGRVFLAAGLIIAGVVVIVTLRTGRARRPIGGPAPSLGAAESRSPGGAAGAAGGQPRTE